MSLIKHCFFLDTTAFPEQCRKTFHNKRTNIRQANKSCKHCCILLRCGYACTWECTQNMQEGIGSLGAGDTEVYDLSTYCKRWDLNSDDDIEASLQALKSIIFKVDFPPKPFTFCLATIHSSFHPLFQSMAPSTYLKCRYALKDKRSLALETLFPTNWNRIPSQTHTAA